MSFEEYSRVYVPADSHNSRSRAFLASLELGDLVALENEDTGEVMVVMVAGELTPRERKLSPFCKSVFGTLGSEILDCGFINDSIYLSKRMVLAENVVDRAHILRTETYWVVTPVKSAEGVP